MIRAPDGYTYHLEQQGSLSTFMEIRRRIKLLAAHLMVHRYPGYQEYVDRLLQRLPDIKFEETPLDREETSFTINKGEKISLCLRSRIDHRVHSINLIMYVVLHELAHVASPELNHTDLFYRIFNLLLREARILGIYRPFWGPQEYCGIIVEPYERSH
jgi:hypothetical protein